MFAWTDIALTGTLSSAWTPMTRLMVTGGGNLEAPSVNIVMLCKNCGLKCSMRGLSDPVDLVVIGVNRGVQGGPLYHAAESAWTGHLEPLCPKCNYGPEEVVTGGGMYCDLLTNWYVPTYCIYLL
jgi:hypothetical protein